MGRLLQELKEGELEAVGPDAVDREAAVVLEIDGTYFGGKSPAI